ncbi:D-glycero-beta-D-manno-heptose 1-phosphate adenylyltransferase [Adhaeribacter aquaticus]|uniref:D-glycero-beta-D-manno-heptose 1-phosphate adenylyltransferase n=1 Tax=Adhaeribacter aquaticus TaxID=299567 RepID=UPI0003FCEF33|nr:D-glycero-beta-D-manno-heptose 1-phosphate adenylyltransferase [Adhaeribacter aquaticus]
MKSLSKIFAREDLVKQVKDWKAQDKKIVFTNGCFDLLHLGHVDYLEKARSLGDKLIVGVNTDASVSRLKGPHRPLQDELSRARIMASLLFIDAVVLFDEDTPYELIKSLLPDILVKGDDYNIQNIVGHDIVLQNGGDVKTIRLVKGYSTSGIVEKIKAQIKA